MDLSHMQNSYGPQLSAIPHLLSRLASSPKNHRIDLMIPFPTQVQLHLPVVTPSKDAATLPKLELRA